jgi:hypothetical protein
MRNVLSIFGIVFLLAIGGVGSARAQVVDTIEADIPFDFVVTKNVLPAGHYTMTRLDSRPGIMELRSTNHEAKAQFFLTESTEVAKEPEQTVLIFDRIGDQYFLSKVFEIGSRYGVEVLESRVERDLEKEGAMIEKQSVLVPAGDASTARQ